MWLRTLAILLCVGACKREPANALAPTAGERAAVEPARDSAGQA